MGSLVSSTSRAMSRWQRPKISDRRATDPIPHHAHREHRFAQGDEQEQAAALQHVVGVERAGSVPKILTR